MASILSFISLIIGASLIGSLFGWQVGLGVGLLAFAVMPYPPNTH